MVARSDSRVKARSSRLLVLRAFCSLLIPPACRAEIHVGHLDPAGRKPPLRFCSGWPPAAANRSKNGRVEGRRFLVGQRHFRPSERFQTVSSALVRDGIALDLEAENLKRRPSVFSTSLAGLFTEDRQDDAQADWRVGQTTRCVSCSLRRLLSSARRARFVARLCARAAFGDSS